MALVPSPSLNPNYIKLGTEYKLAMVMAMNKYIKVGCLEFLGFYYVLRWFCLQMLP